MEIIPMPTLKAKTKTVAADARFKKFARAWKSETELVSKVSKRILHPAHQKIIGMGEAAIPLILNDLSKNGPDDWFWALTAITDENPITEKIAGNMAAMTEAWLQWGRNAGYLKNSPKRRNGSSRT
jgi:hypothetical protein